MLQLAMALMAAAVMTAPITEPVNPSPYAATYSVRYRGFNVGLLHFELRKGVPGTFVYESRAEPGLLARLIVGNNAVERSVMHIDASGVRPLSWYLDDGKSGNDKDGVLEFGWDENRVSGVVEGERVELATESGLQDRLSLQIAVMTALLRGREPGTIALIDGDKIKRYSYTRAGNERIRTKAGTFETVLYESTRPGSSRISRVWHAPELGYIPVRAEQMRNGKVETVMELLKTERGKLLPGPISLEKAIP